MKPKKVKDRNEPVTAADPKSLLAYLRGLNWPPMEPPDDDEFLAKMDIMGQLDLIDDLLAGTLDYLIRKKVPPQPQIEGLRDLHLATLNGFKEELRNHRNDSLKNGTYINELITFIDELSSIAASADVWVNNNLQKEAKPRTK